MRLAIAELDRLFGERLSWRERMAGGPPWLSGELVATNAARARLRRWLEAGSPEADAVDLPCVGDASLGNKARDLLADLPMFCVWYIAGNCLLVAVGKETRGWCGYDSLRVGRRIVALSGQVTGWIILHEFAHAILHGNDSGPIAAETISERTRAKYAPEWFAEKVGGLEHQVARRARQRAAREKPVERQADALANLWNGRRFAAKARRQPDRCSG